MFFEIFDAGYQKCFDDYSGLIISHGGVYIEEGRLKCEICASATWVETSDIPDAVAKVQYETDGQWFGMCKKHLEQIKYRRPLTVEYIEEEKKP